MLAKLASVTACALALTVVSATTAQAASRTFVDGPGDVWVNNTQVPDRTHGDILRTTLTHTQHQVIVRTSFADLKREGRILIYTKLRTNTGEVRELQLNVTPNSWRGTTLLAAPRGGAVECPGISHSIDYATNVAVVRVPRTCLGNPRTVQAKFGVATWNRVRRAFLDNPINHGNTQNLPPYTAPVRVG